VNTTSGSAELEQQVLDGIRGELVQEVGRQRYRLWFRDVSVARVDSDRVTLAVPTEVHRTWLQYTYGEALSRACGGVLGEGVQVELRVDPAGAERASLRDRLPALPDEWEALVARRRPVPTFSSYVAPPGEPFAVRLLEQFVHGSGESDPPSVYLYGEAGTGKSHLLRALHGAVERQAPGDSVYLTSRRFTTLYVSALRAKQVEAVKAFEVGLGARRLILLDGVESLAGRRATEAELSSLRERAVGTRTRFVLAGRRHPREIETLGTKLRSWLLGGVVLRLKSPGREGLGRILDARALQFGADLPAAVRDAILDRTASVDGAVEVLERWAAASSHLRRPLPVEWLSDLSPAVTSTAREEVVRRAKDAVARHYGIARSLLDRSTKVRSAAHPRRVAMYLVYRAASLPLKDLGRAFGLSSHSTVSRALATVRSARTADPDLEHVIEGLLARM
jgi:chromosomal replication initiator protein